MPSLLGERITWNLAPITRWHPEQGCSITEPGAERSGVVWSAGPVSSTAWVVPDEPEPGEGHAVCVRIDADGKHRQGDLELRRSTTEHHAGGLAALQHRFCLTSQYAGTVESRDMYGNAYRNQPMGYSLPRGLAGVNIR